MDQLEKVAESVPALREYLERMRDEYGERFDPSGLNPDLARYFRGPSIIAQLGEETVRATVVVTTGWKPVFIIKVLGTVNPRN